MLADTKIANDTIIKVIVVHTIEATLKLKFRKILFIALAIFLLNILLKM